MPKIKLKYPLKRAENYSWANRKFIFGPYIFTMHRSQYRVSVYEAQKGNHNGADIWYCSRMDIQPALTLFKKWLLTSEYNK